MKPYTPEEIELIFDNAICDQDIIELCDYLKINYKKYSIVDLLKYQVWIELWFNIKKMWP